MAKDQFIITIGASVGGLEALTSFFEHTPLDSVSYVIIPHLSPDFKSRMVEILSKHSNLEVVEANNGMEVETNKIYLIPNTQYMGINNGHLFMFEKSLKCTHIAFSERELDVLRLIADGYTNEEAADKLFTSRRTVEGHRQAMIDKTGSRNSLALIRFAVQHGLLK